MSETNQKTLNSIQNEVIRFAPFAVLLFDAHGVVEIANAEAKRILEIWNGSSGAESNTLHAIFPNVNFSDVGSEALLPIMVSSNHRSLELQCVKIDGDGQQKMLIYLSEPDGRRQREMLLEREASTDELSGLANRRAFQRMMESNCQRPLSLAIVDIDKFKSVNDDHGHLMGDDVIQHVSSLLKDSFANSAILISRMGGDEFSVLFASESTDLIVDSLESFRREVANSELSHSSGLSLSVSIGAAVSVTSSTGARVLLTEADRQLYQAKNAGRNQVSYVVLGE